MGTQSATREYTDIRVREPKQFKVLMWNDDFTSMEFVVDVLVSIFHKDQMTANTIMMSVHKTGVGVVGVYPFDIAATKVRSALAKAKEAGYPFRMTVEEA